MNVTGFDTLTAARRVGVSPRQLAHWDSCGIVSPSIMSAAGSGSRRRYALDDLLLLAVVRELRHCRVPLASICSIIARIRARTDAIREGTDWMLVTAGDRILYLGADEREWKAACRATPSAVVVNIGRLLSTPMVAADEVRPSPKVCEIQVAETCLQAIVTIEGGQYSAACRAFPDCTVRADREADALVALTERIRMRIAAGAPSRATPDSSTSRAARSGRGGAGGGAAAWGAQW